MSIKVYSPEQSAGLAEKLQDNSAVCAASAAFSSLKSKDGGVVVAGVSYAELEDPDLFPVFAILVSTNWNKNDDIFHPEETWIARKSPLHKQLNIGHNRDQVVGHIVDSFAIDENSNVVADDTDNLPSLFHLLTFSVIYKKLGNASKDIVKLIDQVQSGSIYVSMECVFKDFDYGLTSQNGKNYILQRNEQTAFLTSYLRKYGGPGEYQNYRVGRVLRKINFVGQGFVDKPANEFSVVIKPEDMHNFNFNFREASNFEKIDDFSHLNEPIFNKNHCLDSLLNKNGVLSSRYIIVNNSKDKDESLCSVADSQEDNNSLDNSNFNSEKENMSDSKNQNDASAISREEFDAVLQESKTKFEEQISEMKQEFSKKEEELKAQIEELQTSLNETKAESEKQAEVIATLEKERDELASKNAYIRRVATLVSGGVDYKVAEDKVSALGNITDDAFKAVSEDIIKLYGGSQSDSEDETQGSDDDTDTNVDSASDDVVADAANNATQNANSSVPSDSTDDEAEKVEAVKTSIGEFIAASMNIELSNQDN